MASAWSQLDQLLTCAICLDRYRNPKLLPCQHTFCMEPCLDGLIDYARRQIKCPECRAEHRIPYKGIQEFPTNVTLMRFLELHRDITGEEPEPPPSMMERCGVCSEKANLEKCAHCDKKICPDCKEAHIDILRREINRINNQVRRGLHRLADALSQTKKNAEKLQQNCSQVKDEIEDIVKRYAKDLKHTEEKLKNDLQIYTEAELKAINKLKEDLEAEVSNMTSNCDLVDKHIKDDDEWSDAELLEYKDIFIKMLDFLRSFDADTTDYSRKIKFQPRADPDVLHRNIADFGELKINAPPSASIPSQQSLAPPSSNALMRSQSDHRLAAQFARRTEGRSFTDRYGGSDSERDPGRPTSPLYGRGRRDTDSSSGYRRYTRDYDYERSNRYAREDNVSSSILSSRWRDSDEYGHRSSRYPRDYEDYDSEPQQQQNSRTVRFAEDPPQRVRIFDVNEATKGPLSGVIRLMDSSKLMERLHQNEVRHKQHKTEKDQTQPVVETPPQTETRVPTAPQAPPRKTPVRQLSEDDIDRQKKANQQANSSSSTNAQQSVPQTQESMSRSNVYKLTSETAKTPAPTRAQRKDSTEIFASTPAENVTSIERQESRVRKQPSIPETTDEPETTTPSITRRSKPTLGKTLSSDERGSTAAQQQPETSILDKKTSNIATPHSSLLTPRSKHYEANSKNEDFHNDESPIPVQSSFFSRQRRLPDPEPRLLQNQTSEEDDDDEDDEEEDDEDEEEEEEEEESEDESDIRLPQADVKQFQANKSSTEETVEETESEESSTDSSTSESESDDSDQVEEESNQNGVQDSSREIENKTTTSNYRSPSPKYESPLEDEDDDDDEEVEDAMDYGSENRSINSEQKVSLPTDVNNSRPRFRRRSDDLDTAESSSGSSTSTNYKSFSNTPTVLSNGTIENNSVDSENSSSTSTPKKEPRFSSPRKRPTLARSKSSHELGIGSQAVEDVDDEEIPEDTTTTPSYRSRSDRTPEDNVFHQRPRRKYGSLSSDTHSSTESAPGLSPTSSSWATYLKNKYSSGGSGRVVPRSRSSHSLYQKSDSESSDDETSNAVLGGSIGFPNPRSTYMQKRRMLLKIGSRGTEPGNFTWPRGIAVAPDDSIVVADSSNHRVQVFDTEGHFSFEFGSYGSCEGQFDCLSGVSVNRIGQFIVSDRYNHRVQLFDPSGRFLRAFGSEGHTDGRFNYPWGITTDSLGFIYVCDKDNHRVQVFQSDGTFVGKFGCLGSRPGQLEHPHYIAVSNTNRVVVSDSNNHRVQIYDVNGRTLSTFGSEGSGEGQFKFPRGVAVDDQGFIIVGDSGNNRIQIFHPDGTFLRGFGTWGSSEGEFKGLEGIAVASSGNILVCDRENHRIQVF